MFKDLCDIVNTGDNVIIALGDSFTQGVGAYSLESWEASHSLGKGNVFNLSANHFREEQHKNNWAAQLRDTHFPDYKVWNLGINGTGNRGTIKEMYLNPLPSNLGNVIVILMATGIERFDFLKKSKETGGPYNHQRWQTIWPIGGDRGDISVIEKVYQDLLYSPRSVATEFLLNVAEAQHFCKARGYKFLFGSAFDAAINRTTLINWLDDDAEYIDIVNWKDFIKPKNDQSFMSMMCRLEDDARFNNFFEFQNMKILETMSMPLKYITPCMHWTIEGQSLVAGILADEIKARGLL